MNQSTAIWWKAFTAKWGAPYGADPQTWEGELTQQLGEWSAREVIEAMDWASHRDRAARFGKPTTAVDLAHIVATHRRALPATDRGCAYCCAGWIGYRPDWRADMALEAMMMAYAVATPCICATGQHVLATAKDYRGLTEQERREYRRAAQRAQDQRRAIDRLAGVQTKGTHNAAMP